MGAGSMMATCPQCNAKMRGGGVCPNGWTRADGGTAPPRGKHSSISPEDSNALVASAERHRARVARAERIRLAERDVIAAARRLARAAPSDQLAAESALYEKVRALDEAEATDG